MKLLSIEIYTADDKSVLVLLNILNDNCLTHGDYSSCVIDSNQSRKSKVRVLVADLKEGESRRYGCDVKAFTARGKTTKFTKSIVVTRTSEWVVLTACKILYMGDCVCLSVYLSIY